MAGRVGVMQGVAVAILFILIAASWKAWVEIELATRYGPHVLGPMDMGGLVLGDLVHLTGACVGGWLADIRRPPAAGDRTGEGGTGMLHYALLFLLVGLVAGALGLAGVAAVASQIAWVLFLVGIILLVVHLARGRRSPV